MTTYAQPVARFERDARDEVSQVPLQTFQRSFEQICAGEEPWHPLGNFMHQFFGQYTLRRADLMRDPISLPEHLTHQQLQWAVFCAASVEYLSHKYNLSCPAWAMNPLYTLDTPWYDDPDGDDLEVQEDLRQTTPESFTRRNIFCGDRVYLNKYEYRGRKTA